MIKPRIGTFVADYRRNGTMETLNSIMNYNGGILRKAEIRSILNNAYIILKNNGANGSTFNQRFYNKSLRIFLRPIQKIRLMSTK